MDRRLLSFWSANARRRVLILRRASLRAGRIERRWNPTYTHASPASEEATCIAARLTPVLSSTSAGSTCPAAVCQFAFNSTVVRLIGSSSCAFAEVDACSAPLPSPAREPATTQAQRTWLKVARTGIPRILHGTPAAGFNEGRTISADRQVLAQAVGVTPTDARTRNSY